MKKQAKNSTQTHRFARLPHRCAQLIHHCAQRLRRFARFMDGLKRSAATLKTLIALNLFMAVASIIADWHWLTWVAAWNPWLLPFAPICSLYPLLLTVWCIWYYRLNFNRGSHTSHVPLASHALRAGAHPSPLNEPKKIPLWFTLFIFIGIISYGIMAYVYFPLYMVLIDAHWRVPGNLLWVTVYALQSLMIASELKPAPAQKTLPLPGWQLFLIACYFLFKDYSDRYLGSFIDVFRADFPEWFGNFSGITILTIHLTVMGFAVHFLLSHRRVPPAG